MRRCSPLRVVTLVWIQFAACVLVITFAGVRLSRYGDAIADKTGLSRTWTGVILLATVTSLPELVTGISSVAVVGVPDIAVGDVLGSCLFNLLIFVILDSMSRPSSMYTRASRGHILSAGFGVVMVASAGIAVILASFGYNPTIYHVSLYTPFAVVLYLVAMRAVYQYEKRQVAKFTVSGEDQYPDMTLRQALTRFLLAAGFVVLAGSMLPYVGKEMAQLMGWQQSFVGTLFIAFATSLPELVVTVAALRLGALDMAVGNLFGSNLFNILVLAVDDLLYLKGPLLQHVSSVHAISALSAVMMTGIAIVGLFYRPESRLLRSVNWISVFLVGVYLLNTCVLFGNSYSH